LASYARDRTYAKQCAYLEIPKANIGQHILLDGEIVMRLMLGAIDCSLELFTAVDDWIAQNWTLKERRQRRARRPAFRGGKVTTIASALMDWV
jgi:hypothetical protein